MAEQYANPSGWFGRIVTSSLLNRVNHTSNRAVFNALTIPENSRVLEIGFGGAELLVRIARDTDCLQVHGVEKSGAMLVRARKIVQSDNQLKDRVTLHHGDLAGLSQLTDLFDCWCSVNTVYFWPELESGANQIASVTRPGGQIVLGFGTGEKLAQNGYAGQGFKFYSPDRINQAMAEAGLQLEKEHRMDRNEKDPFIICTYRKHGQ